MRKAVVKFTCSTLAAQDWGVQILGVDMHNAHQAMLWWHPTYKTEEDGTVFLRQKEEDWQQMLAQGQYSSQKKNE